jgi:hypothetical protein
MGYDAILGPDDLLAGRPFTHPEKTKRDAEVMRDMLKGERERARGWLGGDHRRSPGQVLRESAGERRKQLLVVPDTRALVGAHDVTAVGFFGQAREDLDHTILFDLEEELVGRMADYADVGLLSYYDLELVKGAYGNLILFSTPDVPDEWHTDPVHRQAVEISPRHYHTVRLHKGSIAGRLLDEGDLVIERTKYFDFTGPSCWQGLREFPADTSAN